MRRKDRMTSKGYALKVIEQCLYATLATVNEDLSPYAIAISPASDGKYVYFHCAKKGKKIDNMIREPRVCLSCVGFAEAISEKYTMSYESAVVFGRAEAVTDEEEMIYALRLISEKYSPEHIGRFDEVIQASLKATAVYRISIDEVTGKANMPERDL
ncbi:MAG: pyridoxamine 5'-phosphate oxidase family protein [Peptostreptococcaceae bacterium]|nr:pyridoxamine 5'-phosphate oxidase family protein [Peptostreptococcaceae bacterium]